MLATLIHLHEHIIVQVCFRYSCLNYQLLLSVCDLCILRRDHHCSFGAICIGHFNQRYFVAAIFNLLVVAIACTWYNFHWVFNAIPHMRGVDFWWLCLPHLALVLRYLSLYQFFAVICLASSVAVVVFDLYLIAAQVFCLYRGQSRMEYLLVINTLDFNLMSLTNNMFCF